MCTYPYTCIHMYIYVCTVKYIYTHKYMYTYVHECKMLKYISTQLQLRISTYIQIHLRTPTQVPLDQPDTPSEEVSEDIKVEMQSWPFFSKQRSSQGLMALVHELDLQIVFGHFVLCCWPSEDDFSGVVFSQAQTDMQLRMKREMDPPLSPLPAAHTLSAIDCSSEVETAVGDDDPLQVLLKSSLFRVCGHCQN